MEVFMNPVHINVSAGNTSYTLQAQEKKPDSGGITSMVSRAISSVMMTAHHEITVDGKTYAIPDEEITRISADTKLPREEIIQHFREYEAKAQKGESSATESTSLLAKEKEGVKVTVSEGTRVREQSSATKVVEEKFDKQRKEYQKRLAIFDGFDSKAEKNNLAKELVANGAKFDIFSSVDIALHHCSPKVREEFFTAVLPQLKEISNAGAAKTLKGEDVVTTLRDNAIKRFAEAASPELKLMILTILESLTNKQTTLSWGQDFDPIVSNLQHILQQMPEEKEQEKMMDEFRKK